MEREKERREHREGHVKHYPVRLREVYVHTTWDKDPKSRYKGNLAAPVERPDAQRRPTYVCRAPRTDDVQLSIPGGGGTCGRGRQASWPPCRDGKPVAAWLRQLSL